MSVIRKLLSTKKINRVACIASALKKNYSDYVLNTDLPDVEIPAGSIDEYLFSKTERWPHLIATECAVTGRKYTHAEIQTKSVNLSRNIRKKLKFEKGDVVAVLLPNCPEYVLVVAGALKAGLIVTTLNPIYTPDEISRQLQDSAAKAIITLTQLHPMAKASANLTKQPIEILTIKTEQGQSSPEGAINFEEFIQPVDYPDLPPASHDDIAFIPYSSGTTGLPKGVELTHRNIVANLCQFSARELTIVEEPTSGHQDVIPAVLPTFHIYGLMGNTIHLYQHGCRIVSLPKFTPELYLNTLKKYNPHVLFVAPPLILFLTGHPSVTSKDLQAVRTVICGAAPLGSLDEERFLEKAQKNINMVQGFGLTETSPLVTLTRPDLKKLKCGGSIGRPVSRTSVKIVDPNDPTSTPLGPNQAGELLIKGPQVMKGYHKKPQETKEVFTEDGWLRTGDIMFYNDDRLLFVKDRLKELIKVKGFQVPPAELEEVIRDFPDVDDVGVIGIAHPTQGEVPRAFIVPKAGKSIDKIKLDAFVSEKVAPYKRLKGGIEIVESIPKNTTGKILRRVLKEQYERNLK